MKFRKINTRKIENMNYNKLTFLVCNLCRFNSSQDEKLGLYRILA